MLSVLRSAWRGDPRCTITAMTSESGQLSPNSGGGGKKAGGNGLWRADSQDASTVGEIVREAETHRCSSPGRRLGMGLAA